MIRGALVLTLACGLMACSHEASRQQKDGNAAERCTSEGDHANWRARWQAETAPVIDKRQGQEAMDNDEADIAERMAPCP